MGGSVLDHSAVLKKVHQGTWSPRAEVTIRGVPCLPGMATLRIPGTLSHWLKVPLRNTARAITGTNILAQKLGPWVKYIPCGQRCERCIHMATTETKLPLSQNTSGRTRKNANGTVSARYMLCQFPTLENLSIKTCFAKRSLSISLVGSQSCNRNSSEF